MQPSPRATGLVVLLVAAAVPLRAQDPADAWLERCRAERSETRERHCEVRSYTIPAGSGLLTLDATPNGGVVVRPWDQAQVRVMAKVQTQARRRATAERIAEDIRVDVSGREVRTSGPRRMGRDEGWSVSFEVWAPAGTPLRLSSTNGGLSVEGMRGPVEAGTTNGGITLRDVAGSVRAETVNGGVEITLADTGGGAEIRARSTNGGIRLSVPRGFSARVEARTVNGGVSVDPPYQAARQGRRYLQGQLGSGGPLLALSTTNGGIRIRQR